MAARKTPTQAKSTKPAQAASKTPAQAASKTPTQAASKTPTEYKFSFGPWNISTGADPFGPPVRKEMEYARKLKAYKELGFDAVQFHDDDIVPADLDWPSTLEGGRRGQDDARRRGAVRRDHRPAALGRPADDRRRLHRRTTPATASTPSTAPGDASTSPARSAARTTCSGWRARARYIREAKDAKTAVARIVDAWNAILEHDKEIRVLGEAKPNEPMDQAYLPTVGHMIGVAYKTIDPGRSGVLIESAHSILAGLDPADDMAYALYHDKLWSVHLNDQNGLKYDQDKVFGSVDLAGRSTRSGSSRRTATAATASASASTSRRCGPPRSRSRCSTSPTRRRCSSASSTSSAASTRRRSRSCAAHRQYEQLEMLILNALMGRKVTMTPT